MGITLEKLQIQRAARRKQLELALKEIIRKLKDRGALKCKVKDCRRIFVGADLCVCPNLGAHTGAPYGKPA